MKPGLCPAVVRVIGGAGNCGDHLRLDHFIAVILMLEVTVSGRVGIQTRVFGFFWDSRNTRLLDFSGAEFRITEGEWTRKKKNSIRSQGRLRPAGAAEHPLEQRLAY